MGNFDFNKLTTVNAIKNEFLPLLETEKPLFPDIENSEFNWLMPILSKSLDEFVADFMLENPPISNTYILLDLAEHVSEASELINKNLQKRNEIFEIETQALFSGVEYAQVLTSLGSDKKLNDLSLNAFFKQSGFENIEEYNAALDGKFDVILSTLRTKLSFHNQQGNPLNFGERVNYLRTVYCENMKVAYERLIAVKRTLLYSFNQKSAPLPNYRDSTNNLEGLVGWLRKEIYQFEIDTQRDYVFHKSFSLNNPFTPIDLAAPPVNPHLDTHAQANKTPIPTFISDQIKNLKSTGTVEFEIKEEEFDVERNFFETISKGERKMRVLGISFNVLELMIEAPNTSFNRETRLYYSELVPPRQNNIALELDKIYDETGEEKIKSQMSEEEMIIALKNPKLKVPSKIKGFDAKGNLKIEKEAIPMEDVVLPSMFIPGEIKPVYNKNITENLEFRSDNSIKNISPVGKWTLYLKNSSPNNMYRAYGLSQVEDIVITFKIGVRKTHV